MSHFQGICLIGITPSLPYESSEKIGRIESLNSRDFRKTLPMTPVKIYQGRSGWQSLFASNNIFNSYTLTLPYLTKYGNFEGHLACWVPISSSSWTRNSHRSVSGMEKVMPPQCLSRCALNWFREAERTTEGGSEFQSFMARTARAFLRTLEVAWGFLNFIGCPLVVASSTCSKN